MELPEGERIETGYLVVFEDRARPAGRTIRLPAAIVRSRGVSPAPDPVVYTAGGPGSSSLSAAAYGGAYRFIDTRDLIVFEQRGTRYAQPSLECPEVDSSRTAGALGSLDAAGDAAAAGACRARLSGSGIDVSAYTTAASAADLEDLRRVLGIAKWNLYGVSYSTRLMLTVLRDFPDGVRSVVLDSPLPPEARYAATVNAHLTRALTGVLRDCAAQPACRVAYPNLSERLAATLDEADRSPVFVGIDPPAGDAKPGAQTRLRLGAAELVDLLNPDDTDGLPGLPRLMDQIARRDAAALRPLIQNRLRSQGFAWGMRYSVWCGEEAPGRTGREIAAGGKIADRKAKKGSGKPDLQTVLARLDLSPVPEAVCRNWPVPPVPGRCSTPVRSAVPTLLITGEYDPYTSQVLAASASRTLSRSYVLTLRGMGHVPTQVWDQPCAMNVAAAFVNAPDMDPASGTAAGCLAGRRPPTFTTAAVP
jgi:pimeloyl-ACP methyl ester carboxylesterase